MKLREVKESDAEQIAKLLDNKKIWDNLRDFVPHPYTLENAKEFIFLCQSENSLKAFIIDKEGLAIGVIALTLQQDIYRRSAEIGYWLGEPYWNKGFITQAIKMIVEYGFNHLGLARIYSGVFENNKASQKALEKAGFIFECVFEKAVLKNGQLINEHRYSIVNKNI